MLNYVINSNILCGPIVPLRYAGISALNNIFLFKINIAHSYFPCLVEMPGNW